VAVGPEFYAFAARVLAPGMAVDAGDVAQAQAAALVAGFQLRLDLPVGVVQEVQR